MGTALQGAWTSKSCRALDPAELGKSPSRTSAAGFSFADYLRRLRASPSRNLDGCRKRHQSAPHDQGYHPLSYITRD